MQAQVQLRAVMLPQMIEADLVARIEDHGARAALPHRTEMDSEAEVTPDHLTELPSLLPAHVQGHEALKDKTEQEYFPTTYVLGC